MGRGRGFPKSNWKRQRKETELNWKTHCNEVLGFLYDSFHLGHEGLFFPSHFLFNIKEVDQNVNPVRLFLTSTLFSTVGGVQAPCFQGPGNLGNILA